MHSAFYEGLELSLAFHEEAKPTSAPMAKTLPLVEDGVNIYNQTYLRAFLLPIF